MAEDDHLGASGLFIFRKEGPPERGLDAEEVEVIGRHRATSQTLRLPAAGQIDNNAWREESSQLLERAALFAVIEKVERADARPIRPAANVTPQPHQPLRFGVWQRS